MCQTKKQSQRKRKKQKLKNKILFILVTILFVGCVVPRNYSRAKEKVDRIVNKFPEILKNDTIVLNDTVFIPEVLIDTLTELKENDTIFIEKERIKVRVVRMPGDTIEIKAECKTDTIVRTIAVPIYTVEEKHLIKKEFLGLGLWAWILIAIIFVLLMYIIFRERK